MNSACGRSPAAADWLPLEAEKQGCGPFRGRDFPDAGKVTKGAPGEPSERFPWTPPPDQGGPIAPRWIPPHMLPGTVILWRTPVPRLPEGGSNGGNRRAVSPLAVGEGFQRGPHIPSMIAPKPLASGRRGGAIEHLRVFPALSFTGKTMPARFATTKVPFGGFLSPISFPAGKKSDRRRQLNEIIGRNSLCNAPRQGTPPVVPLRKGQGTERCSVP